MSVLSGLLDVAAAHARMIEILVITGIAAGIAITGWCRRKRAIRPGDRVMTPFQRDGTVVSVGEDHVEVRFDEPPSGPPASR
jgi:hypothetical protein